MTVPIILASSSPRRSQLLQQIGLEFSVLPVDIDETAKENELAAEYVLRLAREKACAARKQSDENTIILAADTIVAVGNQLFGKPRSLDEAMDMWQVLSDKWHSVHTGVALSYQNTVSLCLQSNEVLFKPLTKAVMLAYWQTGEPKDKAGGYAIQGRAASWVKKINGSYSGIMGLPLYETTELLKKAGFDCT